MRVRGDGTLPTRTTTTDAVVCVSFVSWLPALEPEAKRACVDFSLFAGSASEREE